LETSARQHTTRTGSFFAYVGLWIIFTQLVTTRLVAARLSEPQVLRATLLGVSVVMAAYTFAPAAWWIFVIAPFASTFNGLSMANMGGLLSRSVAPEVQGEISGNWLEYPGARSIAAAAGRRVHRGVTRARRAGCGCLIHDVPGVGDVRSALPAGASRGARGAACLTAFSGS
jgi:hypothetical protein